MRATVSEVQRDLKLLVPAFRERVEIVLNELREQGYDPVVHETLRTKERAEQLVKEGKSLAKGLSMHCLGLAVDCICRKHRWGCHQAGCDFFERYGVIAENHGLCWGGRWTSLVDLPHAQCIPVRLQALARSTQPEHLDTFARVYLANLLVTR
jgi:hypothetical protein